MDKNDKVEQEVFKYTDELHAILNWGFKDVQKIKKLLNETEGDQQRVIQELVTNVF